ncbi:MAG: response regulator transcription factor [Betaproteobacteria bacterium]|nr:response regulator transcription factor [Betaproteobacteria bacterium]
MTRIRIILADDHTLVRAGMRTLLEAIEGVDVVAEAANGRQALELTRKHRPDMVVLDIGMAEMDGLQATAAIKSELPEVRAIILSMHDSGDIVEQALRAGASAYLVKDAAITELELAVRAVSRGDVYLSPAISRQVVAGYVKGGRGERVPAGVLTPRQQEILQLLGEGRNTKEIARLLNLSGKTVEAHRAQIMERLGVRDIANLMLEAIRRGLISVRK